MPRAASTAFWSAARSKGFKAAIGLRSLLAFPRLRMLEGGHPRFMRVLMPLQTFFLDPLHLLSHGIDTSVELLEGYLALHPHLLDGQLTFNIHALRFERSLGVDLRDLDLHPLFDLLGFDLLRQALHFRL